MLTPACTLTFDLFLVFFVITGENMNAPNLYSVITIMSFIGALPLAALVEGPKVMGVLEKGIESMGGPKVGGGFVTCTNWLFVSGNS